MIARTKEVDEMTRDELIKYANVLETRLGHFRDAVKRSRERVLKVAQNAEGIASEHRNALATLLTLQQEAEGINL